MRGHGTCVSLLVMLSCLTREAPLLLWKNVSRKPFELGEGGRLEQPTDVLCTWGLEQEDSGLPQTQT